VALVTTDISENHIFSIISSLILSTLMMEEILSSEMSVLTRATLRNISEDGSLDSHRRETHKSYKLNPLNALNCRYDPQMNQNQIYKEGLKLKRGK
jgi:hypothetical protein